MHEGGGSRSAARLARLCALLFVLASIVAHGRPADAAVTVELSDQMSRAMRDAGLNPAQERQRLERDFNDGLAEQGRTSADAKALHESGQTIRIVCSGEREARDARISANAFQPGETRGDFQADGKPRPGGKALIAIDCPTLARVQGLDIATNDIDGVTMFQVLVHELLHACNSARRHPPDDLDIYVQWVRDFVAGLERIRKRPAGGTPPRGAQAPGTDRRTGQAPSPSGAGNVGFDPVVPPGTFYATAAAAPRQQGYAGFKGLRFESGNVVVKQPVIDESRDSASVGFRLEGGYGLATPFWGASSRLAFAFDYFSAGASSSRSSISAGGDVLGVEDPFGGGVAFASGFSDLTDVRFRFDYRQFGFMAALSESFPYGEWTLTGVGGVSLRTTDHTSRLEFTSNGGFTDIARQDKVSGWSIGPVFGGYASRPVWRAVSVYGGALLTAGYAGATGEGELALEGLGAQTRRLDDISGSAFLFDVKTKIGARMPLGPGAIDIGGFIRWNNDNPVVAYHDGRDATVDHKGAFSSGLWFGYTVAFGAPPPPAP